MVACLPRSVSQSVSQLLLSGRSSAQLLLQATVCSFVRSLTADRQLHLPSPRRATNSLLLLLARMWNGTSQRSLLCCSVRCCCCYDCHRVCCCSGLSVGRVAAPDTAPAAIDRERRVAAAKLAVPHESVSEPPPPPLATDTETNSTRVEGGRQTDRQRWLGCSLTCRRAAKCIT